MIGIDTNVVVRFLVQDDEEQSERATHALAKLSPESPGFIATIVLAETYWVLTRAYRLNPPDVLGALGDLTDSDSIVIQDPAQTSQAFDMASRGADFPDALIAAACRGRGCTSILSFDTKAAQSLGFSIPGT